VETLAKLVESGFHVEEQKNQAEQSK
jgi:hypothetical protein